MAVTYLNESQHSFLRATTDLEWTQDPPGLPVLSWGVQWRRAWAGALDLARAPSLPLWNGSESLETRHPRTQRNRQTRQGDDKEVSLSQACSSAKANKMQDHEYAFAREQREGPRGFLGSAAKCCLSFLSCIIQTKVCKDTERQTDFSSSPARGGGAPMLLIIVLKYPKDS